MKRIQTQRKNQYFVLFWLGLLTGALLIVALYSMDGNSADLAGKLRRAPTAAPTYNYTTPPAYNPQSYNSPAALTSQPIMVAPQMVTPYGGGGSNGGSNGYVDVDGDY
ncbi:MAG: hypothetical protein Q8P68_03915 [Candidatus Peregrinibacteria bacterium]|nr:hypothetical protein [Candidatus Peregrinibacteria bacterium]MDZ4245211.1 hypothetical protein [Candidatus Gracilibacteria bacterium]